MLNHHLYVWHGKPYKTLTRLKMAAQRRYPGCSLTFDPDAMVLTVNDGQHRKRIFFDRVLDTKLQQSTIADQPRAEAA